MTVPSVIVARFLGPEFPSLFGGLIGLVLVMFTSSRGFLMPRDTFDFGPSSRWSPRWTGNLDPENVPPVSRKIGLVHAWGPYALLAGTLVLSRVVAPVKDYHALLNLSVPFENILGTGVSTSIEPFYSPAFLLILAAVFAFLLHRMNRSQVLRSLQVSARQLAGTAVALLFAVPLVRVLIQSGPDLNDSGLGSMPVTLAEGLLRDHLRRRLAVVGSRALGAFVAGSNTISNLTFSQFQFSTGARIGAPPRRWPRRRSAAPVATRSPSTTSSRRLPPLACWAVEGGSAAQDDHRDHLRRLPRRWHRRLPLHPRTGLQRGHHHAGPVPRGLALLARWLMRHHVPMAERRA